MPRLDLGQWRNVVACSRLMGRDESATLARLRKNRSEHLDPVFDKYAGRLEHHCARELDQSPVAGQLDLYYARSNSHEAKMRRWLLVSSLLRTSGLGAG